MRNKLTNTKYLDSFSIYATLNSRTYSSKNGTPEL